MHHQCRGGCHTETSRQTSEPGDTRAQLTLRRPHSHTRLAALARIIHTASWETDDQCCGNETRQLCDHQQIAGEKAPLPPNGG